MIKKLIGIALLTFVISACRNVEDSLLETPVNPIQESRLIAYPKKSDLGNMTRSETVGLDWENWETVALASGVLVAPPWANNPVASDIPEEIRKDIKATDGWDLIVHTVNGYGEQGLNYLIFHNKFTGILKVFYYLEQVVHSFRIRQSGKYISNLLNLYWHLLLIMRETQQKIVRLIFISETSLTTLQKAIPSAGIVFNLS